MDYEKPDIIFIDTLISFHTADESKQGEMTEIYQFLLNVAKTFNCAVVVNHHTRKRSNKGGNSPLKQDDVIGTNAGIRLASCVYIAEQEDEKLSDNDGMPTVWIRNVKSWDKKLPDLSYKFTEELYTRKLDFLLSWGLTENAEEYSTKERMINLVKSYGEGAILTPELIAGELCISKDNARKQLEAAAKRRIVEAVSIINNQGRTATAWRIINVS